MEIKKNTKKYLFVLMFLCFCSVVFAADEIRFWCAPAQQRCAVINRASDLWAWDRVAATFAASVADANRAITLTESSNVKGLYTATFPATIAEGDYDIVKYDTNSVLFDSNNVLSGGIDFSWDGSEEITFAYLNKRWVVAEAKILTDVNGVAIKSNTLITDVNRTEGKVDDIIAIEWITKADVCDSTKWVIEDYNSPTKAETDAGFASIYDVIKSGGTGDANAIWTLATAIKADTDAVDTNSEARIRLTGSDTPLAILANQTTLIADANTIMQKENAIGTKIDDANEAILASVQKMIDDLEAARPFLRRSVP